MNVLLAKWNVKLERSSTASLRTESAMMSLIVPTEMTSVIAVSRNNEIILIVLLMDSKSFCQISPELYKPFLATDKTMEVMNLFVHIERMMSHVPISCMLYEVFEDES